MRRRIYRATPVPQGLGARAGHWAALHSRYRCSNGLSTERGRALHSSLALALREAHREVLHRAEPLPTVSFGRRPGAVLHGFVAVVHAVSLA